MYIAGQRIRARPTPCRFPAREDPTVLIPSFFHRASFRQSGFLPPTVKPTRSRPLFSSRPPDVSSLPFPSPPPLPRRPPLPLIQLKTFLDPFRGRNGGRVFPMRVPLSFFEIPPSISDDRCRPRKQTACPHRVFHLVAAGVRDRVGDRTERRRWLRLGRKKE